VFVFAFKCVFMWNAMCLSECSLPLVQLLPSSLPHPPTLFSFHSSPNPSLPCGTPCCTSPWPARPPLPFPSSQSSSQVSWRHQESLMIYWNINSLFRILIIWAIQWGGKCMNVWSCLKHGQPQCYRLSNCILDSLKRIKYLAYVT